jgi:hypothetical protein
MFGVYQPLIGWRSQLHHERLSNAIASRVMSAGLALRRVPASPPDPPRLLVDRTGTKIGKALASHVPSEEWPDVATVLRGGENSPYNELTRGILPPCNALT